MNISCHGKRGHNALRRNVTLVRTYVPITSAFPLDIVTSIPLKINLVLFFSGPKAFI